MNKQEDLYANYWLKIKETIGADSYDETFDEFLRNWLMGNNVSNSIVARSTYHFFKRHVSEDGNGESGQKTDFHKEISRYSDHYSRITAGNCEDEDLEGHDLFSP